MLSSLLPLLSTLAASPPAPPPYPHGDGADDLPGWALIEAYSCTACHALPAEDDQGLGTHAPALDQGWYQPGYVVRFLDHPLEHEAGTMMPDVLDRLDAPRREAALKEVLAYFRATALDGGPIGLDLVALEEGRQLYHSIGCVACHAPYEEASGLEQKLWEFEELFELDESAPAATPFPHVRDKFAAVGLSLFLASPAGHSPHLPLEAGEGKRLADYIWFEEQGLAGIESETGAGLLYEYFEGRFPSYLPHAKGNEIVRTGIAATPTLIDPREDDFAFRFRGFIEIPSTGWYTFATVSDDGSFVWIDGELLVDNGGLHGPRAKEERLHLDAGKHAIEIGFFEHGGGSELLVEWEGPGISRQALPASVLSHWTIKTNAVERAPIEHVPADEQQLSALGCLACHAPETRPQALPLARLRPREHAGCLAPTPAPELPRYALSDASRAAIIQVLEGATARSATAEQRLTVQLQQKGCTACHRRDETGGPDRQRMAYFQVDTTAELGDEGRIPPPLDGVGGKLHSAWMEEVIRDGARSRPYMKTRMPSFPSEAARLVELFQELDASPDDLAAPEFSVPAIEAGRDLVGINGLGCIQCHDLAGYPSLGIPAVDLAKVHARIKPAWFRKLLLDPIALNMNTRMPTFWTDGKSPVAEHYGGDPAQQIDALWSYLALGNSMPLPEGLIAHESEYELDAAQRPTLVSAFGKGLSPRTLFIGYPERIHATFDVQNSRLAQVWRGRFFNARGTWYARAGELEEPWGEDVFEFPPGPPFAVLEEAAASWPGASGAEGGYRVVGRRLDEKGRPTFRYALGAIEIEESPVPRLGAEGGTLARSFRLSAPNAVEGLYFRALMKPAPEVRVSVNGGTSLVGAEDTRIPVLFSPHGERYQAQFSVEYSW